MLKADRVKCGIDSYWGDEEGVNLVAYKNECARPNIDKVYSLNDTICKYAWDYITGPDGLRKDIYEVWFPEFIKYIPGETPETFYIEDIQIKPTDPQEYFRESLNRDNTKDHVNYETELYNRGIITDFMQKWEVSVKFHIEQLRGKSEWVPILKLPWIREDGVISYEGKEYSYVHMLEQADGITHMAPSTPNKSHEISIKTGRGRITLMSMSSTGVNIKLGSGNERKFPIVSLISPMIRTECPNFTEDMLMNIWEDFRDTDIIGTFGDLSIPKNKDKFMMRYIWGDSGSKSIEISDMMSQIVPSLRCTENIRTGGKYDLYNTRKIRDELNKTLSLNIAKNRILYKDIVASDGTTIAKAGEIVTDAIIDMCNRNGIWKIYIQSDVSLDGVVLGEDVFLSVIPKGTLNKPEIAEAFPEEYAMYTINDHYFRDNVNSNYKHIFVYPKGSILTQADLDCLRNSGYDSVKILNDTKSATIYFYTEVITNRQFRGDYLGKDPTKWYYLDLNNEYIIPDWDGFTVYDIIALWSYAVKLFRGDNVAQLPNTDSDFRKYLVPISDQLRRAVAYTSKYGSQKIAYALQEFWRHGDKTIFQQRNSPLNDKFYSYEINCWKYLLNNAKCIKMIPAVSACNPLSYISELTKANIYSSSKRSIAGSQRMIAIGSYGKIDPYEIPQTQKLGVVNNLAIYTKIDEDGTIRTPYYKVLQDGSRLKISKATGYHYLTIQEEENCITADINNLTIDADGYILEDPEDYVLCRVPAIDSKDNLSFERCKVKSIDYVSVVSVQTLSWVTSAIPFAGNNDAARVTFACAQMKQAKGLVNPEEPFVMTSAYRLIPKLNNKYGYVVKDDTTAISLNCQDNKTKQWHLEVADSVDLVHARANTYRYKMFSKFDNSIMQIKQTDAYLPVESDPRIHYAQKDDTVIASNFVSKNGILQFGVNAFVLFVPDGYNYEDSVHVSQKFAQKMKSYRINSERLQVKETSRMPRIMLGRGKSSVRQTIPYRPNTSEDTFTVAADNIYEGAAKVTRRIKSAYGYFIGQVAHRKENGMYDGVQVNLLSTDNLEIGDKLSNRHGNKCTVCSIDNRNMPILNNGFIPDATQNPLGVDSRMNIGQIKEAILGLCNAVLRLNRPIETDSYGGMSDYELTTLLHFCYDVANETEYYLDAYDQNPSNVDAIVNKPEYKDIPKEIKDWVKAHPDYPQVWKNTFDRSGLFEYSRIIDTGEVDENGEHIYATVKSKEKAFGGYIYMFKPVQESTKKIHARANDMQKEEYSVYSDAPTHGASRGGGQRSGTMEIDALCAYGVSNYIHEVMNEKSDNAIARQNFNIDTYFNQKLYGQYKNNWTGQRRSVTQLWYMLLALGIYPEIHSDQLLPLDRDNGDKLKVVKTPYLRKFNINRNKNKAAETTDTEKPDIPEDIIKSIKSISIL